MPVRRQGRTQPRCATENVPFERFSQWKGVDEGVVEIEQESDAMRLIFQNHV